MACLGGGARRAVPWPPLAVQRGAAHIPLHTGPQHPGQGPSAPQPGTCLSHGTRLWPSGPGTAVLPQGHHAGAQQGGGEGGPAGIGGRCGGAHSNCLRCALPFDRGLRWQSLLPLAGPRLKGGSCSASAFGHATVRGCVPSPRPSPSLIFQSWGCRSSVFCSRSLCSHVVLKPCCQCRTCAPPACAASQATTRWHFLFKPSPAVSACVCLPSVDLPSSPPPRLPAFPVLLRLSTFDLRPTCFNPSAQGLWSAIA